MWDGSAGAGLSYRQGGDAQGAGELQGVLACSGARQEELAAVCVSVSPQLPPELRFPLKYILGEMGKNAG